MTKGICDELGLPYLEEAMKQGASELPDAAGTIPPEEIDPPMSDEAIDKMATALTQYEGDRDAEDHAKDTEKLYQELLGHSRDLMDLGYNVDPRSMRGIFEQAANFYKTALDAKNSKRDRQLTAMKLMLEKRKLDLQLKQAGEQPQAIDSEAVIVEDRNKLLKRLRAERDAKLKP